MKRLFFAVFLISFIGCKGSKGDKGDGGGQNTFSYQGSIILDDQLVFVSSLNGNSSVSVYIGDGVSFSPLNSWSPGLSLNIYFIANMNARTVEIVNAHATGLSTYKIIVTNGVSASLIP